MSLWYSVEKRILHLKALGLFLRPQKTRNSMSKLITFLQEAKSELLKVNWPNRETLVKYTLLVIGMSIVVSLFLGTLDYFFSYLVETFLLN